MLQALLQNISEILVVIDASGIIRFSNPQLERVLGLRTEAVIGHQIFDYIHPDDRPRAALEFADTVQNAGERVPSTLRIRDASGDWIPFEIVANNQIKDPDVQGVVFTARDLRYRLEIETAISLANADVDKRVEERTTELARTNSALRLENQSRRETERRLQETISLLNATLNSTRDGILVVSKDRKVSGCNRQFFEMWHLDCHSAEGISDTELLSSILDQLQDPDEFISKVEALYASPHAASSSDVLKFKDGRIFERYSQPQRMGEEIVGRVWSFRDVTESRRLEEELRQSQKLEALGRLAGGVAHDFNNLLMLITGYLAHLAELGLSSGQVELCEQATAAAKRAANLTRQLLAFSRKHRDSATVTNLNTVVSNVHAMLRALLSVSTRLDISLIDDPVPILADVAQLEIVLMNLAINAQDAMPNGGVLVVTTGQKQDSQKFAVLSVSDTGRGMTEEVQRRIFEPFFTTKAVGKGTGLGLSTVHAIVQRFGGHIEVESRPHEGTKFRIYFPETAMAPEVKKEAIDARVELRGHGTILLAEDEVGIRAMTRAYLESLGYTVLEAADGSEAIKISREYDGPIDLVLTDVLMPVVRGDAVVRSIRRERADIKALFISGFAEDVSDDDTPDLLLKPFDFPELGRRIRSILDFNVKHEKLA